MNKQIEKRWAWVLTGSGHFFTETIDLINNLEKVDLFISKAAEEVLVMYKKKGKVSKNVKIYQDNSASSASVGNFYKGTYHTLVMFTEFQTHLQLIFLHSRENVMLIVFIFLVILHRS